MSQRSNLTPEVGLQSIETVELRCFAIFAVMFLRLIDYFIQNLNIFVRKLYFRFYLNWVFPCWHFPSEKFFGFQSKFRGTKRILDPENTKFNPRTVEDLQSADKFCRLSPCKMSEFSIFILKKLTASMHALCMFCLHVSLGYCILEGCGKN